MNNLTGNSGKFQRTLLVWLILCAAIRLIALFLLPHQREFFLDRETASKNSGHLTWVEIIARRTDYQPLTVDEHCYDEMARNLLAGRGFVLDSVWIINTPGEPAMYAGCSYPLFIAALYGICGSASQWPVYLSQITLQVLALWFVYRAAENWGGPFAANFASAFFTFHPVLIWLSLSMMSEALLVPGAAFLCWIFSRTQISRSLAFVTGVSLGVMALARSTATVFLVVALCFMFFRSSPSFSQRLQQTFMLLLAFILICAPWTYRNYVHWNRFIPFSTKSGVNAWFFNHPGLEPEFNRKAVEGPQPIDIFDPRIQGLPDEAARNDQLMKMFQDFVFREPVKFLGLCWVRFWMALLPVRITSTTLNALISAWYVKGIPLLLLIMLGIRSFRNHSFISSLSNALRRYWPLLLLVLLWQGIQTLAGPGMRYRLPVEPAWAIIIGLMGAAAFSKRPRNLEGQSES
ncbi:MAG: glycosyltransferase family 39 protein [Verrucomicrobiota bacterium]|nr:glycosyltransferase family 39 protein [Verrucomicrobiota bacterium]